MDTKPVDELQPRMDIQPILPPEIEYPDIPFWRTDIRREERFHVINADDLPTEMLLESLGLENSPLRESFGICVEDEIRRRHALCRFLHENPDLMDFIMREGVRTAPLPESADAFLTYFSLVPHNPHWRRVHAFLELMSKVRSQVPANVREFAATLRMSSCIEPLESQMAVAITGEVEKMSVMAGTIEFTLGTGARLFTRLSDDELQKKGTTLTTTDEEDTDSAGTDDDGGSGDDDVPIRRRDQKPTPSKRTSAPAGEREVYLEMGDRRISDRSLWTKPPEFTLAVLTPIGCTASGHRKYASDLTSASVIPYPEWSEGFSVLHPKSWVPFLSEWKRGRIDIANEEHRRSVCERMVITKVPDCTVLEVMTAVLTKLRESVRWNESLCEMLNKSKLKVRFAYDHGGLKVEIFSLDPVVQEERYEANFGEDFAGYTTLQQAAMQSCRREYLNQRTERVRLLSLAALTARLQKSAGDLFYTQFGAKSPGTDQYFRWFALKHLYTDPALHALYEAAQDARSFFDRAMQTLCHVSSIIHRYHQMQDDLREKKLPHSICFADIQDGDDHVVAFKDLLPIQLLVLGENQRPRPIGALPDLNGDILVITGEHGGGKSVALKTIGLDLWSAMSGLPIFGSYFKTNIKQVLGVVFVKTTEKESASTCSLLWKKTASVLAGIKNVDGRLVVVLLDELGFGTQEQAGYIAGNALLQRLKQHGASVILATQIQMLAAQLEQQGGAACFRYDRKHRLTPGIGDGNLPGLLNEVGLGDLLAEGGGEYMQRGPVRQLWTAARSSRGLRGALGIPRVVADLLRRDR